MRQGCTIAREDCLSFCQEAKVFRLLETESETKVELGSGSGTELATSTHDLRRRTTAVIYENIALSEADMRHCSNAVASERVLASLQGRWDFRVQRGTFNQRANSLPNYGGNQMFLAPQEQTPESP
jgi:hypothetical protein